MVGISTRTIRSPGLSELCASRIVPRLLVKVGHAQARLLAVAQHDGGGVERGKRRGQAGHDRADAVVAGEQTVVAVLAVARVAEVAAFLEADGVAMAVIPAARMLREIAADGGDVADLRRGDFRGGVVQAGKDFLNFRVVLDFRDGDKRADGPGCFRRARFGSGPAAT